MLTALVLLCKNDVRGGSSSSSKRLRGYRILRPRSAQPDGVCPTPRGIENYLRNTRLLLAKVITKQSIARDVPGVHTWQRMVHEEMYVELRDTGSLGERPIRLAEFVAHFDRSRRSSLCSARCPELLSAGKSQKAAWSG